MKKMRIHIYIAIGIALVFFILGSFLDLNISEALFHRDDSFGLMVSAIGTLPGYGMFAVLGGGLLIYFFNKEIKILYRVLSIIMATVALGLGTFFAGREFFGPNGFTGTAPEWVGFLIALPIMCGLEFFGYKLFKKSERKYLWLIIVILFVALFIALVPGVTLLKGIFHRPRYRAIEYYDAHYLGQEPRVFFHNWWEKCKDYNNLIASYDYLIKEEFKSFPSGHAGATSCFMMVVTFLPLLDKKYESHSLFSFYAGFIWVLIVCFTRILVGAHFLSDVSMGMLITFVTLLITNEVVIHLKQFKNPEPEVVQE